MTPIGSEPHSGQGRRNCSRRGDSLGQLGGGGGGGGVVQICSAGWSGSLGLSSDNPSQSQHRT